MDIIVFCSLHTKQEYLQMIKSRVIDGDRYETTHSGISHGGYFTAVDELAFPNYMVHLTSHNYFIMDIDV